MQTAVFLSDRALPPSRPFLSIIILAVANHPGCSIIVTNLVTFSHSFQIVQVAASYCLNIYLHFVTWYIVMNIANPYIKCAGRSRCGCNYLDFSPFNFIRTPFDHQSAFLEPFSNLVSTKSAYYMLAHRLAMGRKSALSMPSI
jgi:hypothetical protein